MNTNSTQETQALQEYSDKKRLSIFKLLTSACTHLYSKGKLQPDKWNAIVPVFADLCKNDPIFIAHLCVWATKGDSKDLKILSLYFNALNTGDGTPFYKGAKKNKPNFRQISSAMLQNLDPHLALRVLEFCHLKFGAPNLLNEAAHFPTGLLTAFKKYLKYRESNPEMLQGIKRSGLSNKLKQIYRLTHTCPSDDAASILNWPQKDKREIKIQKLPDFSKMSGAEIVETLEQTRLSPQVALSVLPPDKITARIAEALLNNATGNQAIILYNWFAKNGHLDNESIKKLFKNKVQQSTTAIDRIDTLTRNADVEDKKEMAQVRSEKRKATAKTSSLGKIFMHIDTSGSMQAAIEFAKEKGSIFAECVDNPKNNFRWGTFSTNGHMLPLPEDFTKESFFQSLFGVRAGGSTDCIACYQMAREFKADVDIYVSDSDHNIGSITKRINDCHTQNQHFTKPRIAIIIDFAPQVNTLEDGLKRAEIPVVRIRPESLNESALVAQSIRTALVGELAIIEEIMNTPLPSLPSWFHNMSVNQSKTTACVNP